MDTEKNPFLTEIQGSIGFVEDDAGHITPAVAIRSENGDRFLSLDIGAGLAMPVKD